MNGLSDSLTIGLVLALVFGALFFYLYSRIGQVEKRMSLTENILLDLKMATENTMMAMSSVPPQESNDYVERVEPVSQPEPVQNEEVEQIPDEEFYKQVLEEAQNAVGESSTVTSTRVEPNYESMTLKELKAEAKRKGISVSSGASKKDVIDSLKRQGQTLSILEAVPGTDGTLEEGFPVELGEK
jgi:hypothetical protein